MIQEEWFISLEALPKLRTYTRLKYSFSTKKYIYNLIFRSQRSLIAQLRCGVLPIAIEIDRYTNKAAQDRLYTLCNTANVEDKNFILYVIVTYIIIYIHNCMKTL